MLSKPHFGILMPHSCKCNTISGAVFICLVSLLFLVGPHTGAWGGGMAITIMCFWDNHRLFICLDSWIRILNQSFDSRQSSAPAALSVFSPTALCRQKSLRRHKLYSSSITNLGYFSKSVRHTGHSLHQRFLILGSGSFRWVARPKVRVSR